MKVLKVELDQTREVDTLAKIVHQGFNDVDVLLQFCKSSWEELHINVEELTFDLLQQFCCRGL